MIEKLVSQLQKYTSVLNTDLDFNNINPIQLLTCIKNLHELTELNKLLVTINKSVVDKIKTYKSGLIETINDINMLTETGDKIENDKISITHTETKKPEPTTATYKIESFVDNDHIAETKHIVVNKLENIPECVYYYEDPKNTNSGYYINICGNYMQIPLLKHNKSDNKIYNHKTVRCTRVNCIVSKCNFVHKSERFNKIYLPTKCLSCPTFGDLSQISGDIQKLTEADFKLYMMYTLSDLYAACVYLNTKKYRGILTNLDVCR